MIFNDRDRYIGESFNHYGEFSESEVIFYLQLVQPGSIIIDIGANIGGITIPLAHKIGPTGQMFAIEPQTFIYYQLCGNIAINNLMNTRCIHAAIGDHTGTTRVPRPDYNLFENYGGIDVSDDWSPEISEEVHIFKLDDFQLSPHFIKIDVESAELGVLHGGLETIKRCRPIISIEAIHNKQELKNFFEGLDYRCLLMEFMGYNPTNFFKNPNNILDPPNVCSPNFICIPNETRFSLNGSIL